MVPTTTAGPTASVWTVSTMSKIRMLSRKCDPVKNGDAIASVKVAWKSTATVCQMAKNVQNIASVSIAATKRSNQAHS